MISGSTPGSHGLPITWDLVLPQSSSSKPGVVVIVHGFKGFKDWGFFPELAKRIAANGMAALSINTSHNGVGLDNDQDEFTRLDVFADNQTSFEVSDIETMIAAIQNDSLYDGVALDKSNIALLGHSRGGAAVLLAAARQEDMKAVVTWASVNTVAFPPAAKEAFLADGKWAFLNGRTGQTMTLNLAAFQDVDPMPSRLDLQQQVNQVKAAMLFIHGKEDTSVPVQSVFDLARFSDGNGEIYLVEGADHVFNCRHPFAGPTPELEAAILRTLVHFQNHLTA
ncbi:MAG: dienelactone hydrolase [Planctomycetota bacterium]|jgi:dienelactone hydrolase